MGGGDVASLTPNFGVLNIMGSFAQPPETPVVAPAPAAAQPALATEKQPTEEGRDNKRTEHVLVVPARGNPEDLYSDLIVPQLKVRL